MSELSLLTIIGLGLLLGALGVALKIGFWVWLVSRLTAQGREERRLTATQPPSQTLTLTAAAAPARSSGLDTTKKVVTIVAAVLGIVSTTAGLVNDCSDDPGPPAPAYPDMRPGVQPQPTAQPQPEYHSATCCADGVSCVMMNGPQPLGTACMCFDAFGNTMPGQVC